MSAGLGAAVKGRITRRFDSLRAEGRSGLVTFTTAGDPDPATFEQLLKGLPGAGADLIEIGLPFSDPVADGRAIQAASIRALSHSQTVRKTLAMVRRFREQDTDTPIILMGYANPLHRYGIPAFARDAAEAGVDGMIVVDIPPEEDDTLGKPLRAAGIDVIRLATPTSDDQRLPKILRDTGGFVYFVSVTGTTGAATPDPTAVAGMLARLRRHTSLPVAVGFGIRTPAQATAIAQVADATVVGSAIVDKLAAGLDTNGVARPNMVQDVLAFVNTLAVAVRNARSTGA